MEECETANRLNLRQGKRSHDLVLRLLISLGFVLLSACAASAQGRVEYYDGAVEGNIQPGPPEHQFYKWNTIFLWWTYEIELKLNADHEVKQELGTAFIVFNEKRPVLVTAAHILESLPVESCVIHFRAATPTGLSDVPTSLKLREHGKPIWRRNPVADVAVMDLSNYSEIISRLNTTVPPIDTSLFITAQRAETYRLQAGDDVHMAGFPYDVSTGAHLPILRFGHYASLTSISDPNELPSIDIQMYPGNSGSPVFIVPPNERLGVVVHPQPDAMLLGVAVRRRELENNRDIPLNIGTVVPAPLILETIKSLARTK